MKHSNKKLLKHLLVLMLCFVFSSAFSQTVTLYGPYQIGSNSDNLVENAIFVERISPYKIITAHNSVSNPLTVKGYISTNDGSNWESIISENYCDPTVIITNNGCKYVAMLDAVSQAYTQINVNCDGNWNAIPPSGPGDDKPFFWYDNINDQVY